MKRILVLLSLLMLLSPLAAKSYKIDVSYDKNNNPIEENDLYFLNMTKVEKKAYIRNCTDDLIRTYYKNPKGKWVKYYSLRPNDIIGIKKSTFDNMEYLCFQYCGNKDTRWSFSLSNRRRNKQEIQFGDFGKPTLIANSVPDYYVNMDDFSIPQDINWSNSEREEYIKNIIKENTKGVPIVVYNLYTSEPNSVGGVNLYADFINLSDKTLKYVYLDVTPLNRVNDIARCEITGDSLKTVKATDFIKPFKTYRTRSESLWYNSTIKMPILSGIRLVYTDNTEKRIKLEPNNMLDYVYVTLLKQDILSNQDGKLYLNFSSSRSYISIDNIDDFDTYDVTFNFEPKKYNSYNSKNSIIEKLEYRFNSNIDTIEISNSDLPYLYNLKNVEIKYNRVNGEGKHIIIDDFNTLDKIQRFASIMSSLHK